MSTLIIHRSNISLDNTSIYLSIHWSVCSNYSSLHTPHLPCSLRVGPMYSGHAGSDRPHVKPENVSYVLDSAGKERMLWRYVIKIMLLLLGYQINGLTKFYKIIHDISKI